MGIYIKGVSIPSHGMVIHFTGKGEAWIEDRNAVQIKEVKEDDIVEIPTPHGRLIDLDKAHLYALDELFDASPAYITNKDAAKAMMNIFEHMPTVIEAEE